MIQIHRLEGFYWVAETGGYARAARAFPYPITQPAVHQQVRKLQEELDVDLFERVGKDRMKLTPAGERLHQFIAPFFGGLSAVLRAVRSGEQSGELHIHAEPLFVRRLLPKWLKRIERRVPNASIELRELATADAGPLRRGDADLLVGYIPDPGPDIATQTVATLLPYLIAPAGSSTRAPTLHNLRKSTFIAYHRDLLGHDLQFEVLRSNGIEPKSVLYASSADTILGFVESGLGYSLVPALSGHTTFGPGVRARMLPRADLRQPVVAAWRKDAPENRLLDIALETAPTP